MHILDIVRNSVEAGAKDIFVSMKIDTDNVLTIHFEDNGRGMSPEMVKNVTDPFVTTRTTRKVGMGLSLIKMNAELTGGSLTIKSEQGKGTTVSAIFYLSHIDCLPFGDLGSVFAMLQGGNPDQKFIFVFSVKDDEFSINSDEIWVMIKETGLSQLKMMKLLKEMINNNLKEMNFY
jgi:Signal transduction histidine kinase